MVSKADVEQAYRLILGREPESAAAVESLASRMGSVAELRQSFIDSEEFAKAYRPPVPEAAPLKSTDWGAIPIDVHVEPADLRDMMRHVEASWEKLGHTELFWSVLTHQKYLASNVSANLDSFYDSGEWAAGLLMKAAERAGIALTKDMTCLELGCGAGRITVWLARHFKHVIGCDISQPHLDAAQEATQARGITNVALLRTNSMDRLEALPQCDVFFSLIVLQHNPPPVALSILRTLLRKLDPGGVGYFQVPTYTVNYGFDAKVYLAQIGTHQDMEMHVLPQKELFTLFRAEGCEVLEVREDNWTGSPHILSNTFFVRKAD